MVSNHRGNRIQLLLYSVFFLLVAHSLQGQRIEKLYSASYQDSGILYFIKPFLEFTGDGDMLLDFTILSSSDSVIMNFTYSNKKLRQIDSLFFKMPTLLIPIEGKSLFIEPYKKKWRHRYTTTVSFADLKLFCASAERAFVIHSSNETLELEASKKNEKQLFKILQIIEIIEINNN